MAATETALIAAVPEVEAVVGRWRASLDRSASWGVPAHVTVLYPFLPPERIDERVLTVLRGIFAGMSRFDVVFTHTDWFDDTVLWLAPQPDRPFRDLTAAVWRRFPEVPPFGGVYAEVIPHLTIGHDTARSVLDEAARAVSAHLPIPAAIEAVRLVAGTPEHSPWRTVCQFALGSPASR